MGWRDTAFRIYWWLEKRIAPEVRYAQYYYEEVLFEIVPPGAVWLDVGCGHQLLPEWRRKQEEELISRAGLLIGLDYDRPSLMKHQNLSVRIHGDISRLPFRDNSFDIVTANMVVEHLQHPVSQFAEIKRVLKPGGIFAFHTPNYYSPLVLMASLTPYALKLKLIKLLEGRSEEDVFPTYYQANTEKSIRHIACVVGFSVEEIKFVTSGGHAIFAFCPPITVAELLYVKVIQR
ncbi:MAG: class I SAM-dependent methyltransferase, partial [bacterium]|nr:class I SAM-dependent methyltransferase [bacterium]